MTWKAANAVAWLAALAFSAGEARAQANAPCPAQHVSQYNPDTYRNDCLRLPQATDKRYEALLKAQQLRMQQLRREQFERSQSLSTPQDIVRGEHQARTQKLTRRSGSRAQ